VKAWSLASSNPGFRSKWSRSLPLTHHRRVPKLPTGYSREANVALSPGHAIYPKPVCHVPNLVHPLLRILRLNRPTSPGLCARAPADRSLQLRPRHTSHIGQGRKLFNHRYWCDGYWLHGTRRRPVTKRSGEGEGPPRTPPDQTLLVNLRSRLREKRSAHGAVPHSWLWNPCIGPMSPSSSCGFTFERPHRRSRRHRSSLVQMST